MILPNKVALFTLAHRVPLLLYLCVFVPFQNPNNQSVFSENHHKRSSVSVNLLVFGFYEGFDILIHGLTENQKK